MFWLKKEILFFEYRLFFLIMGEECVKYRVCLCLKCLGDIEYVCELCNSYFCYNCKEVYFKNLNYDGYIDCKKLK